MFHFQIPIVWYFQSSTNLTFTFIFIHTQLQDTHYTWQTTCLCVGFNFQLPTYLVVVERTLKKIRRIIFIDQSNRVLFCDIARTCLMSNAKTLVNRSTTLFQKFHFFSRLFNILNMLIDIVQKWHTSFQPMFLW